MVNSKDIKLNSLLIFIAIFITIALVIVSSYIQEGYNIKIGDVSPQNFKATKQVEDKITTEKLRDEARATVVTVYKRDQSIENQIRESLNNFFDDVINIRLINETSMYDDSVELQQDDIDSFIKNSEVLSELSYDEINYIISMDVATFNQFQSNIYNIFERLMVNDLREDSSEVWELEVLADFEMLEFTEEIATVGYALLNTYIQPNILIDEEATEKLKEERAAEVEPIIYLQNQNIVNEGEIITEEIYYMLEELGFINAGYTANIIPIIGTAAIIIIIFGIAIMYIYLLNKKLFLNKKNVLLLFTLYITLIISTRILINMHYVVIPILIFTMLVGILLDYKLALVLNTFATIITLLMFKGGLDYIIYFLITGTIIAIITKYPLTRNKVVILSLIVSVLSAIIAGAISFSLDRVVSEEIVFVLIYAFFSGFFTVIICMGTLPLWESVFGVVTPIKLLDLTNPDNELLRRLSIEAPGTYHHSIIVANLSEAAAYDIKADTVVSRVGAYFHDIGKLKYPQYFVENQVGENPHDNIDPFDSFEIIKSHVRFGLELADEKKLPVVIRDIIEQHHGNTKIKYFYYKAKKQNPEMDINEDDFRYNGPTPKSKESAIVMIADTIEAAVRSMVSQTKSTTEIENFIKTLIKEKLDDGQFIDSDLTIKDLDTIQKSFMRVFNGMYHERIPYPKDSINNDKGINKEN